MYKMDYSNGFWLTSLWSYVRGRKDHI